MSRSLLVSVMALAALAGPAAAATSTAASTDDLGAWLVGSWAVRCGPGADPIHYGKNGEMGREGARGAWMLAGDILTERFTVFGDSASPDDDMRFTRRTQLVRQADGSLLKKGQWLSGGDVPEDVVLQRCG
jgi:hypothetical protein